MADHPTEYALPGILGEIARVTTPEIAIVVARTFGGGRLYLRREPKRGHPLVKAVGMQAARLICSALGKDRHEVPSAHTYLRWYDARRLRSQGKTQPEIAAALQISQRQVRVLLHGFVPPAPSDDVEGEGDHPQAAERCPVCGRGHSAARHGTPDPRQLELHI